MTGNGVERGGTPKQRSWHEAIGRRYYIIVNRWKTADGEARAGMMLGFGGSGPKLDTQVWRGMPRYRVTVTMPAHSGEADPTWQTSRSETVGHPLS